MMRETVLSRSMRMMFAGSAAIGLSMFAAQAMAQVAAEPVMQRVEVTGSSIKRINAEGALPVQVLTRAQIDQTGAKNVADLVAGLPSMQGFITASSSVNGGGAGVQSASIHGLGTEYTLVLLNGRRMAPYGTGSAVNLASIPLSAVERVEILADGASTLYGSDAIAGVVNFILKKNQQDLNLEATYNSPQKSGGKSTNFAISKGFGDLEKDGFNVLIAYSHDEHKELNATDRDFARSGVKHFSEGGQNYAIFQTSANSTPANSYVESATDALFFSAEKINSGVCGGANTFVAGDVCRFDYAATVQLIPKLKRDSIFASANFKLSENVMLFGELVLSKFSNEARYAPAAQPLSVISTSGGVTTFNPNYIGAYNAAIRPLLAAQGMNPDDVTLAELYYRGADAGGRTDNYQTDAKHLVLGAEMKFAGWDMNTAYTHSANTQKDDAVAGYMSGDMFEQLVRTGAYNPYVRSPGGAAALAPAVLQQTLSVIDSKLDILSARASKEMFTMGGGRAALGVGADFTVQNYDERPSDILMGPGPQNPTWTDTIIGGGTGSQPLDAKRNSWGVFGELIMPVSKTLEATLAARHDSYGQVEKKNTSYDIDQNPSLPGDVGNDVSKTTFKGSVRWTPVKTMLVRASYGTGFRAPTMNQIADPLKNAGSANPFPCPWDAASTDPRKAYCRPGDYEYTLLSDGNPTTGAGGLKPETSKQFSAGFRVEPIPSFTFGLDLWDVKLKNQIQLLGQRLYFETPALRDAAFSIYFDPIQKSDVLVLTRSPTNLASSNYRGIDWDTTYRINNTGIGNLSMNWTGTYMLKAEQDIPNVGLEKSVGRFDANSNVTFRTISRLAFVLKTPSMMNMMNTLAVNYRSGYHDATDDSVLIVNPDGSFGDDAGLVRDVASYTTLDYQLKLTAAKNFVVTAGIRNLLDRDPPLSIRSAGGGNQVGYDGRYADPLGRTFYITGNYKF
jgi:iron complex outermembrane receptor protein